MLSLRRASSAGGHCRQREDANIAWLETAFARARTDGAIGVVVLMQANPRFELPPGDPQRAGFEAIIDALGRLAAEVARPVLLLHGDGHLFLVDWPLAGASPAVPNLRRVQSFVHPLMEWIRIDVDPSSATVFRVVIGSPHHAITDNRAQGCCGDLQHLAGRRARGQQHARCRLREYRCRSWQLNIGSGLTVCARSCLVCILPDGGSLRRLTACRPGPSARHAVQIPLMRYRMLGICQLGAGVADRF